MFALKENNNVIDCLLPSGFLVKVDRFSKKIITYLGSKDHLSVRKSIDKNYVIGSFSAVEQNKSVALDDIINGISSGLSINEFFDEISRISGEFCIAIIDTEAMSVQLARSSNGVEPIYFFSRDDDCVLGNSVEGIKCISKISSFDEIALLQYVFAEFITEPRTRYEDITAVEAGSIITLDEKGRVKSDKYSTPFSEIREDRSSIVELREKYRHHAISAVEKRIVGTPSVYLSGGIDSNAIAAYLVNDLGHRDALALTFGVKGVDDDEVPIAIEVAQHLNMEHHIQIIDPAKEFNLVSNLNKMNSFDPSVGMISSLAASGGDFSGNNLTIFAGQDHRLHTPFLGRVDKFFLSSVFDYQRLLHPIRIFAKLAKSLYGFNPRTVRAIDIAVNSRDINDVVAMRFLKLKPSPSASYQKGVYKCADSFKAALDESFGKSSDSLRSRFNAIVDVWYRGQLISDSNYMRSATELGGQNCAMPYLDADFMNFCASIPYSIASSKTKGTDSFDLSSKAMVDKAFLRSTIQKDFPDRLLMRKKAVMPSLHLFFNGSFRPYLFDMLKPGGVWDSSLGQYLNKNELSEIIRKNDGKWSSTDPAVLYFIRNLMCIDAVMRQN